jgi:multidrug efflux pump subunit AcrB
MRRFNLTALAVREGSVTLFFIIATIIAGTFAYLSLGRAEDPPFTVKVLTVTAAWPGATAQQMQNLVADPLEKRMQELEWYDYVTTISRRGLVLMTVTLKDTTPPRDVPEEFYQARKKLRDQTHALPEGVIGPFINDEYSDVTFSLYALQAPGLSQRLLVPEAEILRERLLHVPGVEKVNILGERPQEVFVNISDQKLATLGVSATAIFKALQQENEVVPEGSIDTRGPTVFIRVDRPYHDLDAIRATPIVANGHVFKLSDIATVERAYEDPPTYLIRNQGAPALELGVVMRQGWNGLDLGRALDAQQVQIDKTLPTGMTFSKVTDQSTNISSPFYEFMQKFAEALAVVMIVSLLSLGWRVGIVVAAAVPLVIAAVFVVMMMTGKQFDRITLGSLIIALGLLVDDAIITIEIMVVKLEEGWDRLLAASYSWDQTAAPRLAGALITVAGFVPVGFAHSTAGEYAGNIFWVVGFALIISWLFAAAFTPYLGVKLLPKFKPIEGGHAAIYATKRFNQLRRIVTWAVRRKFVVAGLVVTAFILAFIGMGSVKQQFFPSSDRPEVLVDVQLPEGTSIETTQAEVVKLEHWLKQQPEAKIVTSYIGQGAPRFFLAYNPELPDPSFAKIIIRTPSETDRDALKWRMRRAVAAGLGEGARACVSQLVFGPYSPYPVAFRVMGSNIDKVQAIARQVESVMRANPDVRQVNTDWGQKQPTVHFIFDQSRLRQIGLTSEDAAEQLQFLLLGVPVTQVRSDIRTVEVVARSQGAQRLDPAMLGQFTLTTDSGKPVPLSQLGKITISSEYPYSIRRDRIPTITVQSDIDEQVQPPQVSLAVMKALQPVIAGLPLGYRIELSGSIEQAAKANNALAPIFPVMIGLQLMILVLQVRSISAMFMVFLTAPLGLIGAVPVLLAFNQPFGFNAILGLIALSGILMRNTLILMGQIDTNRADGLEVFDAVVEATVQRTRPVLLTAMAAVLAFVPLTSSVFWGSMAYTLIGGTIGGTVLIIVFLPALYAIWFKVMAPSRIAKEAASSREHRSASGGSGKAPAE